MVVCLSSPELRPGQEDFYADAQTVGSGAGRMIEARGQQQTDGLSASQTTESAWNPGRFSRSSLTGVPSASGQATERSSARRPAGCSTDPLPRGPVECALVRFVMQSSQIQRRPWRAPITRRSRRPTRRNSCFQPQRWQSAIGRWEPEFSTVSGSNRVRTRFIALMLITWSRPSSWAPTSGTGMV